jgi:transposase
MATETTAAVGPGRGGRKAPRRAAAAARRGPGGGLALARGHGATLSGWRDAFLAAGEASLATRPADGEALESERLKARPGEMLLERELLEAKIAALEARGPAPLARRRSKP